MKYLIYCFFVIFSLNSYSETLEEGKIYRLSKTIHDMPLARDTTKKHIAVKESKFEVVDSSNSAYYVVRFITLYDFGDLKSTVRKDEEYQLAKKISSVPIEKSISLSRGRPCKRPSHCTIQI